MIYLKRDGIEDQTVLWRYMSLAKYLSLLETKSLWLARADTFEDKQEGKLPDRMLMYGEQAYTNIPNDTGQVESVHKFQELLIKNAFISCWHQNLEENMVMWELYGRERTSVAIRSLAVDLMENIHYQFLPGNFLNIKPVKYVNSDEIEREILYEDCFYHKRRHFSHENEVRISLDTYSVTHPNRETPSGYALPMNLEKVIQSVFVHPDSEDWFYNSVASVTEKYGLSCTVQRGLFGNQ